MTTSAAGHRAHHLSRIICYSFRVYVTEVGQVTRSYFNDRDSLRPNLATEIHKHVPIFRSIITSIPCDRRYLVALARCERCKAGLEFFTVVRSRGDDGRHARAAGRKDQCAKDRRIKSETTMPTHGLMRVLAARLDEMAQSGRLKGRESVICGVVPGRDIYGPRYLIEGEGGTPFLRMNSNSYLGMALRSEIIEAEERAATAYGAGPGAVRFISGTWSPHVALERRLAAFHRRPGAMLYSSAYATMMGLVAPLVTDKTAVISDELNHNCIINAIALARPA